jgi:hypothetical protein
LFLPLVSWLSEVDHSGSDAPVFHDWLTARRSSSKKETFIRLTLRWVMS